MTNTKSMALVPTEELAQKLQDVVLSVTGTEGLNGFKKAYMMAEGIKQLKELLTPEYMAPIMQLQGSKLGFRTDKDLNKDRTKGPGYPMEVVKDCIIEAVLNGLEVTGNQFNIIAGNCYPTKEGCGAILNKFPGLKYQIILSLPRTNATASSAATSAAVDALIKWTLNGEQNQETIPIAVKMDAYTSLDAVNGKATRKARAWLISRITGSEITDGEVEDATATVMSSKTKETKVSDEEIESQRWIALFKDASTVEELEFYSMDLPEQMKGEFEKRMNELKNTVK